MSMIDRTTAVKNPNGPDVLIRGRVGKESGSYGTAQYGNIHYGARTSIGRELDGVYKKHTHNGITKQVLARFPKRGRLAPTPAELTARQNFADGMAVWNAKDQDEKDRFIAEGKELGTTGTGIWMKQYLESIE